MNSSRRRVHLALESLESRDVPAVVIDQKFDTTTVNALPAGWLQQSSDSVTRFAVTAPTLSPPVPSGSNALTFTPANGQNARAWSGTSVGAEATVSASVFLNSVAQTRLLARASALDTATPTFYAATITRGYAVASIVKVVNGVETTLIASTASTVPANYYSQKWATVTLDVSGTTNPVIRAKVQRPDTGQYLNSTGGWVSTVTWAATVADATTPITTGTLTGVSRVSVPLNSPDTGYVDDFLATTPDAPGTYTQSFEAPTFPLGSNPSNTSPNPDWTDTDWKAYGVSGSPLVAGPTAAFSVQGAPASPLLASGGSQVLRVTPTGSNSTEWAWYDVPQQADQTVSASVLMTQLTSVGVLARGTNLGASTFGFYSLTVDRLGQVVLGRNQTGTTVTTVLQSVPFAPVSGMWVKLTLKATGTGSNNLQGRVQRLDTNQYLNSSGAWVTDTAGSGNIWAVTATDGTFAGANSYAGVVKTKSYAPAVDVDAFSVSSTSTTNVVDVVDLPGSDLSNLTSPRVLGTANTSYRLTKNVVATGTAFLVTAPNVTLDLNGYTITYDTGPNPVVPNGGFESPVSTSTPDTNWTISGSTSTVAPLSRVAKATEFANRPGALNGFWGDYVYKVGPYTTATGKRTAGLVRNTQTITSGVITDAAGTPLTLDVNREYAAMVTARSLGYNDAVKINITILYTYANNPGPGDWQPMPSTWNANYTSTNPVGSPFFLAGDGADGVGRGFGVVAGFTPKANPSPGAGLGLNPKVRIRVTLDYDELVDEDSMVSNNQATVYIDNARLLRSRDSGIIALNLDNFKSVPNNLRDGYAKQAANLTVTGNGGSIVQGGTSYASFAINAAGTVGLTLNGVNTLVKGPDTSNLYAIGVGSADISGCTFDSQVETVHNRMSRQVASIQLQGAKNIKRVEGNTLLNSPMAGIIIGTHTRTGGNQNRAVISNNVIRQEAIVSDGYGILLGGLTLFDLTGNTVQPVLGRGLILDGSGTQGSTDRTRDITDGLISGNLFEARERPNLEYWDLSPDGGTTLEATAVRLRNYNSIQKNLVLRNNTLFAETDATGVWAAIGLRVTQNVNSGSSSNANANNLFENNTITAVVKTDDTRFRAYALTIAALSDGTGIRFLNNRLVGNHRLLNLGDNDNAGDPVIAGAVFDGNIYRRLTGTGISDRTAAGVTDPNARFQAVFLLGSASSNPVRNIKLIAQQFDGSNNPGEVAVGSSRRAPVMNPNPTTAQTVTNVEIIWRIAVTVLNQTGQTPVAGAKVWLEDGSGNPISSEVTTDSSGQAVVEYTNTVYSRVAGGGLVTAPRPAAIRLRVTLLPRSAPAVPLTLNDENNNTLAQTVDLP